MAEPEHSDRKWKIQPNGRGFPVSVFDMPNAKEKTVNGGNGNKVSPAVMNGIAIAVTVVWVVSFFADIFVPGYSPPAAIHAAFLGIAGAIFGFQIFTGKRD